MQRSHRLLPWLFVMSSACGSPLSSAVADYEAGRTTQSLRRLQAWSREAAMADAPDAARYALFRGLAHLTLGDAYAAERYLLPLKHRVQGKPSLLSPHDRTRLLTALASMGHFPGD